MKDTDKTKEQLLDEMAKLRQKNAELEASESERKWAEQELRESQKRYQSLTEASPVGIFHSDSQGNYLYVNERWGEIASLSPEEAYGKGWENVLHPDDKKRILTEWYKSCQEKRPFKSEFRFQPSTGISVWVLCQSSVEKNANGEVVGYIGTITDITYRKQLEETMRESEEKYRTLVESASDYIFTIDKDNKVLSLNKAGAFLFRKHPEKIIGKSIFELFPKEIATRYSGNLKKVFKTNKSSSHESKMVVEGKESWLSVSLNPVCDHNGKVESVMGMARDITELKQAAEQIKRSLEEKEVLLKEIHHRVKNNMQIIASLLRIQAADIKDEKIQAIFNGIHDRIRSMAVLYEMLYQSKDMAKVDLSEYIRRLTTHLVSMYRAGLGPISLKLDVKDVYLDVKRAIPCGLIITELVSNSLKHAFPDGKKAEIAVEMHPDKGKKYTLVVKDDGVGFPEGADFRNTKSLGMKLVVDLVKQINGTIDLSRAKGTEFKIVF